MIKVKIKHENDNRLEWGYGIYINGYVTDHGETPPFEAGLCASECVSSNASRKTIKQAERRVRQNARYAYKIDWFEKR